MKSVKSDLTAILSLFASFSTLVCCALPALLVLLGLGAVLAGLVSDLPFLITMTGNKAWTLLFATGIIGANFWLVYGKTDTTCTIPENGDETACETSSRWSRIVLWISFGFLLIGAFMSYLALPLWIWLES